MCPVTDFAVWRNVRRRLWRGGAPTLLLFSGFRAGPDHYGTIPGRNRAARLFFVIRRAVAFVTYQNFQNEQKRSKKRYKSPLRTFTSQNCVWGRKNILRCIQLNFCGFCAFGTRLRHPPALQNAPGTGLRPFSSRVKNRSKILKNPKNPSLERSITS